MRSVVGKSDREREREFARGVDLAEDDVGDRVAGLRAEEPGLNDRRNVAHPGHRHGIAADIDHDKIACGAGERAYHVVLSVGKSETGAVCVLAVLAGTLVEAAHENDIVGA